MSEPEALEPLFDLLAALIVAGLIVVGVLGILAAAKFLLGFLFGWW